MTSLADLRRRSHSLDTRCNNDKLDCQRKNSGRKGGNVDIVGVRGASSLPTSPCTASGPPTAPMAMQMWHQRQLCTLKWNFPQWSTTKIDDAPFCKFCVASNHTTTQCPAIPLHLRAQLSNTRHYKRPTLLRRTQRIQPNGFRGQRAPRGDNSTSKEIQLVAGANNYRSVLQGRPAARQSFASASRMQYAVEY